MATLFEVWGQMNVNLRAKAPGPLVDGDETMTLTLLWALIEWYEFDEQVPRHPIVGERYACPRIARYSSLCRDCRCLF